MQECEEVTYGLGWTVLGGFELAATGQQMGMAHPVVVMDRLCIDIYGKCCYLIIPRKRRVQIHSSISCLFLFVCHS